MLRLIFEFGDKASLEREFNIGFPSTNGLSCANKPT